MKYNTNPTIVIVRKTKKKQQQSEKFRKKKLRTAVKALIIRMAINSSYTKQNKMENKGSIKNKVRDVGMKNP